MLTEYRLGFDRMIAVLAEGGDSSYGPTSSLGTEVIGFVEV